MLSLERQAPQWLHLWTKQLLRHLGEPPEVMKYVTKAVQSLLMVDEELAHLGLNDEEYLCLGEERERKG